MHFWPKSNSSLLNTQDVTIPAPPAAGAPPAGGRRTGAATGGRPAFAAGALAAGLAAAPTAGKVPESDRAGAAAARDGADGADDGIKPVTQGRKRCDGSKHGEKSIGLNERVPDA